MKYIYVIAIAAYLSCCKKQDVVHGSIPKDEVELLQTPLAPVESSKTTNGDVVNPLPKTGLKDPTWTAHFCLKIKSKDVGCYLKGKSKGVRFELGLSCNHINGRCLLETNTTICHCLMANTTLLNMET
jgi:hypothetical protein